MKNVSFEVETDKMKKQAAAISILVSGIDTDLKKVSQIIKRSKAFWSGDASEKHQRLFNEVEEDVQELLPKLREHSERLLKIAGVYEEKEKVALGIVNNLSGSAVRIR